MKERERGIREDKRRVKELYNNECANVEQCHSTEKPHIHHILFRSDGKHKNIPASVIESKSNYIPLCWSCENLVHEKAKGIEVRKRK